MPGLDGHASDRLLAWRPGRRAVWRSSDGASVWKCFRSGRDRAPRAHTERVAAALVQSNPTGPALGIPALLEHDEALARLRFAWVDGHGIGLDLDSAPDWRHFGQALDHFQQAVPIDGLARHGAPDEVALLEELALRHADAQIALPEGWHAAFADLREQVSDLPPHAWVACHRDLHDGQILISGGRPVLLDLDLLCAADPALDAGNLTAHFLLRELQALGGADRESVARIARLFLQGLHHSAQAEFATSLRFYQASSLLRLALVYAVRPRWRALAPQLIDLSRQALAEILPRP
ncbi:MAG: hypothetical protein R3F17_10110 [Planctomycetota bacterium]